MRVAGVDLSAGAVAELALCLRDAGATDLSHRVGVAVDTNRRELPLDLRDRSQVLRALASRPTTLVSLRVGLMIDELLRQRATMKRLRTDLQRGAALAVHERDQIYAAACRTFEQARRTHSTVAARIAGLYQGPTSA